ncbi:MAG: prepilin-type N-terminal cleavage/methylation domain-containing protein, partial [Okeania sp. SIO2F4]|uniref:type IV pilin-like G/H family protein n=1 Tax=Okeania sp. SIO2F4 TaxID=2607790 RepID=UPI00142978E5
MNNLSLKLLQHLNKQNNNHGFTLIELLVTIIIIGILSAIGLGTFLNLVAKAKEAEPRLKINGANKNQWVYYIDNNKFTENLEILELSDETENYRYELLDNPLIPPELSIILATPKDSTLRYFIGIIYISKMKVISIAE